jgi:hypothetical protein
VAVDVEDVAKLLIVELRKELPSRGCGGNLALYHVRRLTLASQAALDSPSRLLSCIQLLSLSDSISSWFVVDSDSYL